MSTHVETKAQRVEGVCLRSFSLEGVKGVLNPKPGSSGCAAHL